MDYQDKLAAINKTLKAAVKQKRVKEETYAAITNDQLRFVDSSLFTKKNVSQRGGLEQLIKQSDSLKYGITNIDKAALQPGEVFIVTGITLAWYQGENVNGLGNYVTTINDGENAVDPALENAELILGQNGNTLIRTPIRQLLSDEKSSLPLGHPDVAYPLFPYVFIADKETFNLDIQFPDDLAVADPGPGQGIWVQPILHGVRTKSRN